MVYLKMYTEPCHDRIRRRCQIIYVKKMQERRVFMEELAEFRRDRVNYYLRIITKSVGPTWYQVLSVGQRHALDTLKTAIYQDILEARPQRTKRIVHKIGLHPLPSYSDLIGAIYAAEKDPKKFFSYLFLLKFGHFIAIKRPKYCLNGKLLLSCLFYLGLENLISLLETTFEYDTEPPPPKAKPKRKPNPPLASPYLEKTVVKPYYPQRKKPDKPLPLPDLSKLSGPVPPVEMIIRPPPPPPPPPPPKKRLPREYCDKVAGVMILQPFTPVPITPFKPYTQQMPKHRTNRLKRNQGSIQQGSIQEKKSYGLNLTSSINKEKHKKPKAPKSEYEALQYQIAGVYTHEERVYFIIGSVISRPPNGYMIHGGSYWTGVEYTRIHGGISYRILDEAKDPCNCLKLWEESVLNYVRSNKCYCGHYYDYHHEEGTFSAEEVPYFEKPTRTKPLQFNYQQIYELDPRALYIGREFKRIWETDSIIHSEDDDATEKKKKKKVMRTDQQTNCLGKNPKLKDYLKCTMPFLRPHNLAAQLPDVHLTQELKEWMRKRVHGNFTRRQKREMLTLSSDRWCMLSSMEAHGLGHVAPPFDPVLSSGRSTWEHKAALRARYQVYMANYRRKLFKTQADVNNLLWATMFQNQFPDKKFREIYFSYLLERTTDLMLCHPYNVRESHDRAVEISNKRVVCVLPKPPSCS